jgi:hypothetical protein
MQRKGPGAVTSTAGPGHGRESGSGDDLADCEERFQTAWPRIRAAASILLSGGFSRNRLANVGFQLAIMQCEPQMQLAFRPVRRQLGNQLALGNERLKLLQFSLKVGHDSPPLFPLRMGDNPTPLA